MMWWAKGKLEEASTELREQGLMLYFVPMEGARQVYTAVTA